MRFDDYGYGAVAAVYEELASLYSRGRIAASKRSQLKHLNPGDRVLYAGVGRGEDALLAARFGIRVTAVDLSGGMLRRLARRLDREGLEASLIQGDVASMASRGDEKTEASETSEASGALEERYDAVVANYFLNLFEVERAGAMLERLAERVRPGGLILCADFALPVGGRFGRWITEAYYRPVNWIAWAVGLCDLHPILDYPRLLEPQGFRIRSEERFPVGPGRNPAYLSLAAEREA